MMAVILAGGRGARLAPYTTVLPKPLMPVGGIPILETVLRQLRHHGFTEIILAVGYLSPLIRAYFDQNPISSQLNIRYHQEREPLGTAGALASIEGLDPTFLVMNGDLLTTVSYSGMMAFHRAKGAALTVAVTERVVQLEVGVLSMAADDSVTGYSEKPRHTYPSSMGIYVCSRSVRDHMVPGIPTDIPDLVLRLIGAKQTVCGYRNDAKWLDIGNPADHAKASEAFERDRSIYLLDGS